MLSRRFAPSCVLAVLGVISSAQADIITGWNQASLDTIKPTSTAPPPAARTLALVHTAMCNAVSGLSASPAMYGGFAAAGAGPSAHAAAAQAARDVLAALYPSRTAIYDARLAQDLASLGAGPEVLAGRDYGSSAATHILNLRAGDGSVAPSTHIFTTGIGRYRATSASPADPVLQQYAAMTRWTMNSASQFRQGPPPAPGSAEYAAAFDQVKTLGRSDAQALGNRTAEQTEIAHFWAANAGSYTPPGQWNQIAQAVAGARSDGLEFNARAFALLNIALSEASIVAWDHKEHYDFWRPITGITVDDDGNPLTVQDTSWTPLLATPPHQSSTSGHSTFSAAAATTLALVYGTDLIGFSFADDTSGVTRSFGGFWQAAQEAGMSRIYGGIHWMFDNSAGLASGAEVGRWVVAQAIPSPGAAAVMLLGVLAVGRRRR
jgi:uncharacterized protein (TIGR03382 family)